VTPKHFFLFALSSLGAVAVLAACGDDVSIPATDAGTDATTGDAASDAPKDSPSDAQGDGGADAADAADAAPTPHVSTVVSFNPATGQLPENVVIHKGVTYVSFAPSGQIVTVDNLGNVAPFATVPLAAPPGSNFLLGFDFDSSDNIFVAVAAVPSPTPNLAALAAAGVWRIPAGGTVDAGTATLIYTASGSSLKFANDVAIDPAGANIYITDSNDGAVYKAAISSVAGVINTPWIQDPLIAGDLGGDAGVTCTNRPGAGFPVGANDISIEGSVVYVSNTDKGSLVQIPINANGSAGAAANVFQDCQLKGFDGFDHNMTDSSWRAAVNSSNTINRVRVIGGTATVTTIASGHPPFDFPDSIIRVPDAAVFETFLVTNGAYFTPADAGQAPSLLKIVIQ